METSLTSGYSYSCGILTNYSKKLKICIRPTLLLKSLLSLKSFKTLIINIILVFLAYCKMHFSKF